VSPHPRRRDAGPADEMARELARLGAPRAAVDPAAVELMKPRTHDRPFSRAGWLFELKYDGFRLLASGGAGEAVLALKRGRDATATFPEIAAALAALPFQGLILDGEIVVLGEEGRPTFQGLQHRIAGRPAAGPAVLFAFDLLACEGFDLRPLPLRERKALLDQALAGPPGVIRPTVCVPERGEQLYEAVRQMGLEGIVGKRLESPYSSGYSPDWLKVREERSGDFAVVGFEPVPRARDGFRNLHLAVRTRAGGWLYVGPVGGGLSGQDVAAIYPRLDRARRDRPVTPLPGGAGIVPVDPEVVVEVRYRELTEAGRLRLPTFLRLRDDKSAAECFLPGEEPGPEPSPEPPPPAAGRPRRPEAATRFTHLDKVLWPGEGITKGELIDYYRAASPWMLPLLAGRPLVLERYPHGVGDLSFIQKSAPLGLSPRLRTVAIPAEDARTHDYVLCDDVEGLLELVNLATIPFHVWSSRAESLDRPDWCILDLDPKDAPFGHVVAIARALRELCQEIELPCHVKTSGGSGLHVLLPTGGRLGHDQSRQLAELLARVVVSRLPAIATTARSLRAREGRVYLDAVQNGRGRLLAAPYAVRPRPGAPVSTPLDWEEVDDALEVRAFNLRTVPERLAARAGDPLLPILREEPDLERSLHLLGLRLAE
jgi:bifunctional non-homologous end joining protein LigD